ncbi:uncharacterized protein LAESUDRAFT_816421 [Laetiporus sulphureus 93-53]|uniref:Uncharacterized protein n=1 Tax=Laetiporus sulphureus 93-53 TaxID=1314785 RepID=A0A165BA85_9APHY|nr:uncharacterized protein LAESUDRAFT_816421 [Laetiporus sulphureus 93-53]KZT00605.1 hypothetical protein LAESUDRAFT_816421 [Laetiporus sulphureus 93-53]
MSQTEALQVLPDVLGPAAHDKIDQRLWEYVKRWRKIGDNAGVAAMLLKMNPDDLQEHEGTLGVVLFHALRAQSDRESQIRKEYSDALTCQDVFSGPHAEEILQMMKTCAENGSFAAIRNLSLFRIPIATEETNFDAAQSEATVSAWSRTFYGTAHQTLYNSIERMNSSRVPEQLYSNYVSIVQSSGTGKSRTVDEMARLVFTFPFNLRAEGDSGYAYPVADSKIRDFLLEEGSKENFDSIVAAYLIFFKHLFEATTQTLSTVGSSIEDQTAGIRSNAPLAEEWRAHLAEGDTRKQFYEKTVKYVRRLPEVIELKQNEGSIKLNSYAQRAVEAGENLIKSLVHDESAEPANSLRLVMYFDEAHSLMQHSTKGIDTGRTRYHALCKAIHQLAALPLFVVMLSTTSQLHKLSPAKIFHPSMRVQGGKQDDLQAPITEMPFDLLCDNQTLVPPGGVTLTDACSLGFICRFGRPLWRAFFMSEDPDVQRMLVDTAYSKLTGFQLNQALDETTVHRSRAHLAALSTRLLLEFEPIRELARKAEVELVESNLRIAYSVPKHREYLRSGYPSEPILAEAAARFLIRSRSSVPANLAYFIESGLINKGERGELVMRLLLLEAFDKATRKQCGNPEDPKRITFDHPIPVIDFLQALFGEDNMETVLDKDPHNCANWRTFRKAFGKAYVHFTHFGKSENESVSNQFGAWAAIMRGMAMQCSTNQRNIDCIIPIVFDLKKKITPDRMSAILIQVKNKEEFEVLAIDEKKLDGVNDFFRKDKGRTLPDNRPYITIAMHLGIQDAAYKTSLPKGKLHELEASFQCVAPTSHVSTRSTTEERMETLYDPDDDLVPPEGPQEKKKDIPHPRYEIVAKKCYPKTFAAMLDHRSNVQEATSIYAYLLGGTGVYDEHPRQEEENLAALRNLKPGWSVGDDYYDWTGNKFLCGETPGRRRMKSNDSQDAVPMLIDGGGSPEDIVMGSQNSD